jgi:hypothetical protein
MALRLPSPVGRTLGRIVTKAYRRRGFAIADILVRWSAIIGEDLAAHTCPERLNFPPGQADGATLRLRVRSGFAPQVQHLSALIVERINTYYGYRAVARLKLVQGALPKPAAREARELPSLTEAEKYRLEALVAGIADSDLAAALFRLGHGILAASGNKKATN